MLNLSWRSFETWVVNSLYSCTIFHEGLMGRRNSPLGITVACCDGLAHTELPSHHGTMVFRVCVSYKLSIRLTQREDEQFVPVGRARAASHWLVQIRSYSHWCHWLMSLAVLVPPPPPAGHSQDPESKAAVKYRLHPMTSHYRGSSWDPIIVWAVVIGFLVWLDGNAGGGTEGCWKNLTGRIRWEESLWYQLGGTIGMISKTVPLTITATIAQ